MPELMELRMIKKYMTIAIINKIRTIVAIELTQNGRV